GQSSAHPRRIVLGPPGDALAKEQYEVAPANFPERFAITPRAELSRHRLGAAWFENEIGFLFHVSKQPRSPSHSDGHSVPGGPTYIGTNVALGELMRAQALCCFALFVSSVAAQTDPFENKSIVDVQLSPANV